MAGSASAVSRTIVSLRNRQGDALHCTLDEPAAGVPRAAVAAVFLCPGVKTRVGPHRLYRKLAAPFLARGIPVMRVDFRGLGDSEGQWPDDSLASIYRLTELGHCVDDARSALDWIESRLGTRHCIVGGLCGGAITALHLAREDMRLAALYAIGLPVRLDGIGEKPGISAGELQSHRARYLRKAFRASSWARLLSFRSDYRLLWQALAGKMGFVPTAGQEAPPDLNPHVPDCFLQLLHTGRLALLMFGERDPRRWDFEEKFLRAASAALEPYRQQISYSIIAGANHILGDPASVLAANRLTEAWLETQLTRGVVRSERGAGAAGIHPHALECSALTGASIAQQGSLETRPGR